MSQLPDFASGASAIVPVVARAHVAADRHDAASALHTALGEGPFAHVILFASEDADFEGLIAEASRLFAGASVSACTTAGEISPAGYTEAAIVAVGFPASHFAAESVFVEDLDRIAQQELVGEFIRARHRLAEHHPDWAFEFAFTLIDGLTMREESVMQALAPGLGGMPLFGGSAGDNLHFRRTRVALDGTARSNAAVITVFRTNCPVKVFTLDHFIPTEQRLIVTRADPATRTVYEINAEPAAREYARVLGSRVDQLDQSTFAAHPMLVRIGPGHHVRGILETGAADSLVFASAIDEGVVLNLAEALDIAAHLRAKLHQLSRGIKPDMILACDCLWRRVEIADRQATREVSALLVEHNVLGFNTYGEQIDAMHVNQTMTGVAIYPPVDPFGRR